MRELVQKDQKISVIPQDFKLANKGEVIDVNEQGFSMRLQYAPNGLAKTHVCEFYSQTQNGMLFFESNITDVQDNILHISNPIKHKFLQRRKFTRIKFIKDMQIKAGNIVHNIKTLDVSAGGMKFKTNENINIELDYNIIIELATDHEVECKFQPIRIEKSDEGYYILSGRFKNLSNVDRMTLIQFCMKKNMENVNK